MTLSYSLWCEASLFFFKLPTRNYNFLKHATQNVAGDILVSKSGFEPRGTGSRRSTTPSHGNMRLRPSSTETLKRVLVVPPTKIMFFNDIFQSKINVLHLSKFLRSISWEPRVMIGWASQMDARETLCCHMFLQSQNMFSESKSIPPKKGENFRF